jgi:hypothetical protein
MFSEYSPSTLIALSGVVAATTYYWARYRPPAIKFQAHSRKVGNLRVTDVGLIIMLPRRKPGGKPATKEYVLYFTSKG